MNLVQCTSKILPSRQAFFLEVYLKVDLRHETIHLMVTVRDHPKNEDFFPSLPLHLLHDIAALMLLIKTRCTLWRNPSPHHNIVKYHLYRWSLTRIEHTFPKLTELQFHIYSLKNKSLFWMENAGPTKAIK